MKSLQLRMTCWLTGILFGIMFIILVAFTAHSLHAVAHSEKKIMKTIARSIARELAEHGIRDQAVPPELTDLINAKLAFIDNEKSMAYAVVSDDHRLLYRTPDFNIPLTDKFLARRHSRLFLQSIKSGRGIDDLLQEWHFLFRLEAEGMIVFVSNRRHFELLEKLINGLFITLGLAILLAAPTAFLFSRRVLKPMRQIDQAAQRIRAGDLGARIGPVKGNDEIARLVMHLDETFAALQKAFTRIAEFSADAAHELKTPLTALRGTLEVALRRERATEEYQQVLAEAIEQITVLTQLTDDLLMLARSGCARSACGVAELDVSALLNGVLSALEPFAEATAVELAAQFAPGVKLSGNESMLRRLAYNLIHNAITFSAKGSTVAVSLSANEHAVRFEVKDHGLGIAPDQHGKVFERFYQVDPSRNRGSGLGLAIAKWIVEFHEGSIVLDSAPGQGTTVTVDIPC